MWLWEWVAAELQVLKVVPSFARRFARRILPNTGADDVAWVAVWALAHTVPAFVYQSGAATCAGYTMSSDLPLARSPTLNFITCADSKKHAGLPSALNFDPARKCEVTET